MEHTRFFTLDLQYTSWGYSRTECWRECMDL